MVDGPLIFRSFVDLKIHRHWYQQ